MTGRHRLRDSGLQVFATGPPFWSVPLENYETFLDVPASADELEHIGVVCERAAERVMS
jgi:hypothetical protein